MVRNGRGKPRQVTLGSGTVTIEAPRVNDKREVDGERQKFTSAILPPYLRRSQNVGTTAGSVSARPLHGAQTLAELRERLEQAVEPPICNQFVAPPKRGDDTLPHRWSR